MQHNNFFPHFVSEVHQIQNICTVSGLLLLVNAKKMLRSGLVGHPEGTVEWKDGGFRLNTGEKFITVRMVRKLWLPHPWTCSKPGWTGLGAGLGEGVPQGAGTG